MIEVVEEEERKPDWNKVKENIIWGPPSSTPSHVSMALSKPHSLSSLPISLSLSLSCPLPSPLSFPCSAHALCCPFCCIGIDLAWNNTRMC